MTKDQNVKYDMYERVTKCCKENPAAVALNATFKADLAALDTSISEIRRLSKLINSDNAHFETKQGIKADMIALGLDVCANLFAYGLVIKDKNIEKMGKQTKTSLSTGKEEEILERCQLIAEKARELLKELQAKRGMPEMLLTKLENATVQFRDIKPEPRSAIQNKSTLIEKLAEAFANAEVAMTLMASSAVNFKGVADDFYARFEKATGIIASKTSTTKIKFVVSDGVTKESIKNFQYESTTLNLPKTLMQAKSALIPTTHHKGSDFTVSSDGYETAYIESTKIIKGKTNIIKVELMPVKVG